MRMNRRTFFVIFGLGLAITLAAIFGILRVRAQKAADHPFFAEKKFQVIAHRGGRSLGPENTIYTFRRAIELGVDVLEMDVRTTGDNRLVVIHDATVDRTTGGRGAVADMSLSQIKSLDAGFRWSKDNGNSQPLRAGAIRVPTLLEVFQTFPRFRMNIEIKDPRPAVAASLCRLIQKEHMTPYAMVACFDSKVLDRFREQCPQVATSAGFSEAVRFFSLQRFRLHSIYSPSALALQVPERYGRLRVVDRQFVDAAHSRNMRVHVWTVNDTEDMRRLVRLGVDGIMTDFPRRLNAIADRK